jgi:hypothetical protein
MDIDVYVGQNSEGYFVGHSGKILVEQADLVDIQDIIQVLEEQNHHCYWVDVGHQTAPKLLHTKFSSVKEDVAA